jgi:DNA adenine methylase
VDELIPHPIPYQGSKRGLAQSICQYVPDDVNTLFEPFAGSAAITLYAAKHQLARRFVIGDSLAPLMELWRQIIGQPEATAKEYEALWSGQTAHDYEYFYRVRDRFNSDHNPVDLLYLIARCVKNAVRFDRNGRFTQSVDKRRLGMRPAKMREAILQASTLLNGRTWLFCGDFKDCIACAEPNDLVYMDPPYQGTTYGRDKRYFAQVEREHLFAGLAHLNSHHVPFMLSYDGMSGHMVYGEELPVSLDVHRIFLHAGRSSQATLNGREAFTVESLYLSNSLRKIMPEGSEKRHERQGRLFA